MNKVLLVVPLSTLKWGSKNEGGVDSVCQMLVKRLQLRDKESYVYRVIAFDPSNTLRPSECGKLIKLNNNVEVVRFRVNSQGLIFKLLPSILYHLWLIKKEAKCFQPDIIHVHQLSWSLLLGVGTPIITTLHSYKKICRKRLSKFNNFLYEVLVPYCAAFTANRYTCVSNQFRNEIKNDIIKPIDVIYNPISEKYFFSTREQQAGNKDIKLVTCALLTRRKGIHHVIEVVKKLVNLGHRTTLTVIGPISEKSYVNEIKESINDSHLSDYISFVGSKNTDEIIGYYQRSDIGIFLSKEETFGLVPLEMLASGLPVICTKTGVIGDIYKATRNSSIKVVDENDYQSIIEHALALTKGGYSCPRQVVEECFDSEFILGQYESVYAKEIASKC
ncbi:VpsD family glycosyltransferase [Vibrio sp. MarTm2]|uniref:VpsD family glycosyltransferase n=1 Tax=Vibrio sp. MarTm2 TaxID=2998831 RepID=UPI0022CDA042|nr:VpsD family glycosyltransferase [Vibrio sp. MarTm2]MDA0127937.1 VpsD family glycosyltransferase [Vibrio sp. MarTm2]